MGENSMFQKQWRKMKALIAQRKTRAAIVVVCFGVIGLVLLEISHAASYVGSAEAESGVLASGARVVKDITASGGSAVQFSTPAGSGSGSKTVSGSTGTVSKGGNNMIVGVNINGLGNDSGPDMAGAVKYARADLEAWNIPASTFTNSGIKLDDLLQGPYSTNGIVGLGSPTTWANNALGWYKSYGCNPTLCPMVEVLNEPGGTWFWGTNAMSQSNATAYDNILIATYDAFKTAYGSSRPLILASFDGGNSGNDWAQYMWTGNSKIANYMDGITVHPYDSSSTGLGDQGDVTDSYAQAKTLAGHGIPVYITEMGYQTAPASGEFPSGYSAEYSGVQLSANLQCNNIYNFISWARGLQYVNAVLIFDYRDEPADNNTYVTYGVEYLDGTHKPSYAGIAAAASNKANPCP